MNDGATNVNQTNSEKQKHESERQTARKWYRWLWLSPLLTFPTLILSNPLMDNLFYDQFCSQGWQNCAFDFEIIYRLSGVIVILGSSLWHLILLIPARNKESLFVRWHGRQELLLAGLRTTIPLIFALAFGGYGFGFYLSVIILIPIWLFGTQWGQRQAARGDCSLMRWTGREDALPGPPLEEETAKEKKITPEDLVKTIRFSSDPKELHEAMKELKELGLVEEL